MGALPTKKLTRARSGRRMIRYRLAKVYSSNCPQCGSARLPHRVCSKCGFYNGKLARDIDGNSE